jgi:lipopolysaccharide/colanic/teichoic acid biosynthesis glycosyltransferase
VAASPAKSLAANPRPFRDRATELLAKRIIDIAGSAVLLALSAPVIVACAVLIRLYDGGPVFHRRRVVGTTGAFHAFKLRTMCVDADEVLESDPKLRKSFSRNFKLKQDPRVTPVGRVLRRFSIDELPQLWNVLRGQLSLVGPRMISPAELAKFGESGWIFRAVKPGVTGYWQTARQLEGGYPQRVEMELDYVENWSLALDWRILMKTPLRVLRGAGDRSTWRTY